MGEVTPPGLRGEGEDRVRANNLRRRICVIMMTLGEKKTFGNKANHLMQIRLIC